MSWYRLGGFSAYFSVPSGRRWNQSGCSRSQGWSGEHWIAKSRAISRSFSRAAMTSPSKSASVPSSGLTAVCPPSAPPIAHGLPGSPGSAVGRVVAPLAVGRADRVDRRQVDDVEAELGQPRELLLHPGEAAERAREELVPRAEAGALAIDVHLVGRRPLALAPLGAAAPAPPPRPAPSRRRRARPTAARRAHRARRASRTTARSAPRSRPAASSIRTGALLELALEILLAGRQLALDLVPPGRVGVHPGLDLEGVAAEGDGVEGALPAVRAELRHRLLQEPAGAGRTVAHHGPELLVAVPDEVARRRPRGRRGCA